jgi:CDP-diglyceride synthetase
LTEGSTSDRGRRITAETAGTDEAAEAEVTEVAEEPTTSGLRISAVEAAVAAGLAPATEEPPMLPPVDIDLPAWTDPPTGQIPRMLLDDPGAAGPDLGGGYQATRGPVWREEGSDWDDLGLADIAAGAASIPAGGGSIDDEHPFDIGPPETGRLPRFDYVDGDDEPGEERGRANGRRAGGRGGTSLAPPAAERRTAGDDPDLRSRPVAAAEHEAGDGRSEKHAASLGPTAALAAAIQRRRSRPGSPVRISSRTTAAPTAQAAEDAAPTAPEASPRHRGTGGARRRPRLDRSVFTASVTGIVVGAVAIACFYLGPLACMLLAAVVLTLAIAELLATLRRAGFRPAAMIALVATPATVVGAYFRGPQAFALAVAAVVAATMIVYLFDPSERRAVANIAVTVFAFGWVGVLGAFAGLLLAPSIFPHRHGVAFFLGAIVATVAYDIGALAAGATLGRRKLLPRVSPGKTWEGLVGGAALAIVASVAIVGQVHPWHYVTALVLGVVVSVVAPLGDLCESLVKRDLGVKDMGDLLPAHGGVLDRFDSLLFVLPAVYYLVRALNIG